MRDRRSLPWCWQDVRALALINEHFNDREGAFARSVYLAMTEIANEQRNDSFKMSKRRIADRARVSKRTLDEVAGRFEQLGLLEIGRRTTGAGGSKPNEYTLTTPGALRADPKELERKLVGD